MNYPEDDQNEINRLHNDFVHHSPRSNDDLIALQDASYALGLKRGQAHEAALQQRLNEADQRIDELEKSLSAVINTGELSREQHEELEADICSLLEHCKKCSTQVALMPSYKRECLKKLTKDSPEVGS